MNGTNFIRKGLSIPSDGGCGSNLSQPTREERGITTCLSLLLPPSAFLLARMTPAKAFPALQPLLRGQPALGTRFDAPGRDQLAQEDEILRGHLGWVQQIGQVDPAPKAELGNAGIGPPGIG